MKKILYICSKPIENWDIFTPSPNTPNSSQNDNSVLLLEKKQDLQNVYASQIWNLKQCKEDTTTTHVLQNISYQEFLEQIFLHDLAMVI